jgi:hypothetical protein
VDNRAKTKVFLSLNEEVVFTATRVKLIVRLCIDICQYSGKDEKIGKLMVAEWSSLQISLHSSNLEQDLLPSALHHCAIPFSNVYQAPFSLQSSSLSTSLPRSSF